MAADSLGGGDASDWEFWEGLFGGDSQLPPSHLALDAEGMRQIEDIVDKDAEAQLIEALQAIGARAFTDTEGQVGDAWVREVDISQEGTGNYDRLFMSWSSKSISARFDSFEKPLTQATDPRLWFEAELAVGTGYVTFSAGEQIAAEGNTRLDRLFEEIFNGQDGQTEALIKFIKGLY